MQQYIGDRTRNRYECIRIQNWFRIEFNRTKMTACNCIWKIEQNLSCNNWFDENDVANCVKCFSLWFFFLQIICNSLLTLTWSKTITICMADNRTHKVVLGLFFYCIYFYQRSNFSRKWANLHEIETVFLCNFFRSTAD